jgi:hypothetical protein
MDIHGDAAAVVDDRDRFIRVYRDSDFLTVAGESFVDGVVDDLEYHVMEASAVVGIPNVHSGAFAHRFKAL